MSFRAGRTGGILLGIWVKGLGLPEPGSDVVVDRDAGSYSACSLGLVLRMALLLMRSWKAAAKAIATDTKQIIMRKLATGIDDYDEDSVSKIAMLPMGR